MLNKKEIRKNVGCIFIAIIGLGVGLLLLGYLSSFVGWYGYKKWKYRVLSENIEESKKRGVFIKQLNYKVEGDCDSLYDFTPFIERGFRFGYHSMNETRIIENSQFPYQLSYNIDRRKFGAKINRAQFDSSNVSWGYLKEPFLKDTIIIFIRDTSMHFGTIKIWDSTH